MHSSDTGETHLTIGTRTSSGSKKRDLVHSLSRPGNAAAPCQLPLMLLGHLQVATQSATYDSSSSNSSRLNRLAALRLLNMLLHTLQGCSNLCWAGLCVALQLCAGRVLGPLDRVRGALHTNPAVLQLCAEVLSWP
jgi:hypothetical protein